MKKAFYHSLGISFLAIFLTLTYKSLTAISIPKTTLTQFFTAFDLIWLLSLVLIGFRSAMVVALNEGVERSLIMTVLRFSLIFAIAITLITVYPYILTHFPLISPMGSLTIILATGFYIYATNPLGMDRRYKMLNFVAFSEPFLALLSLIFFLFAGFTNEQLLVGSISVSLVGTALLALHNAPSSPFVPLIWNSTTKQFLKRVTLASCEFALSLAVIYLALFFMMEYHPYSLGDFQVVAKTLYMAGITLFVFPLFKFVLPEISYTLTHGSRHNLHLIHHWFISYLITIAIVALGVGFFAKECIFFAFGPSYEGAIVMTQWFMASLIVVTLNAYLTLLFRAHGAFGITLIVRLIGSVTFCIIYLFLHHEGALSVVKAFLFHHCVILVLFLTLGKIKKIYE